MDHRLTILLIIPDLGIGGAERAISRLSIELAQFYTVYVCRFTDRDAVVYPYGGKLLSLLEPDRKNFFSKVYGVYARVLKVRKIKRQFKVDFTISFLEGANYVNLLSRSNDAVIISQRGSIQNDKDIRGLLGFFRRRILIPRLYKKADMIVALSAGLKNELVQTFKIKEDKIRVIYNHYDAQELTEISHRTVPDYFKVLVNKPILVTTGRLHQAKGHHELLHVFAKLKIECECRLVIFGDGPLKEVLLQTASNLSLKTYSVWTNQQLTSDYDVYFMGYVRDPFHFLAASTVFVFPSLYEGLGNSLVEALACRITIAAADCHSGPREVLAPRTDLNQIITKAEFAPYGILLPVLNTPTAVQEWVSTLKRVIQDDQLRKTYTSTGLIRLQDFSISSALSQWNALIQSQSQC